MVRVTLDAYYNRLRDMIVSVPYNMFVWSCVNVGKVRILGVDGTLNLSHHLNAKHLVILTGNFSYQRAQNRTNPHSPNYNKQIAYMPEYPWAAAVSYENPWVNLSVHGHGISSRWPNNDHYAGTLIKGYKEFGVTAYRAFSWGRHRMEGRVDVKNLLDEQYELVGHYPMPGRSWQISILYKI
jgi:outer membrane receptor protein involved in Fe transport